MLASLSVSGLSNGTPTLLFLCRASRTLACVKTTVHTIFVASKVPSLLPDKSAATACLTTWCMLLAYCDSSSANVSVLGSRPTAHGFCFSIMAGA